MYENKQTNIPLDAQNRSLGENFCFLAQVSLRSIQSQNPNSFLAKLSGTACLKWEKAFFYRETENINMQN